MPTVNLFWCTCYKITQDCRDQILLSCRCGLFYGQSDYRNESVRFFHIWSIQIVFKQIKISEPTCTFLCFRFLLETDKKWMFRLTWEVVLDYMRMFYTRQLDRHAMVVSFVSYQPFRVLINQFHFHFVSMKGGELQMYLIKYKLFIWYLCGSNSASFRTVQLYIFCWAQYLFIIVRNSFLQTFMVLTIRNQVIVFLSCTFYSSNVVYAIQSNLKIQHSTKHSLHPFCFKS